MGHSTVSKPTAAAAHGPQDWGCTTPISRHKTHYPAAETPRIPEHRRSRRTSSSNLVMRSKFLAYFTPTSTTRHVWSIDKGCGEDAATYHHCMCRMSQEQDQGQHLPASAEASLEDRLLMHTPSAMASNPYVANVSARAAAAYSTRNATRGRTSTQVAPNRIALEKLIRCRRISARKSIRAFSRRVQQLQDFILSHGLEVPPPSDEQNAWTLDSLMEAYASSSSAHSQHSPTDPSLFASGTAAPVDSSKHMSSSAHSQQSPTEPSLFASGTAAPADSSERMLTGATSLDFQDHSIESSGYHHPSISIPTDHYSASATQPIHDSVDYASSGDADWIWNMAAMNAPCDSFDLNDPAATALMDQLAGISCPSSVNHLPHPATIPDRYTAGQEDPTQDAEDENHREVTSHISNRLGRLLPSENGQWRYYGATSNLHLIDSKATSEVALRSLSQQESKIALRLELFRVGQELDADECQHLIKLYFAWHNASLHIVDKEVFETAQELYERDRKQSTFYSPFLFNAM